jgi:hypothetical protein
MKTHSPPASMEERMALLEARIAQLEQQYEAVIRVRPSSPAGDRWRTSAILQNISSHTFR